MSKEKTKAPTGLKVSRHGEKFKFEWKQARDYDKQQYECGYTSSSGSTTGIFASTPIDIGKNATSKTITVNLDNQRVTNFRFGVRGKIDGKNWSSWTTKTVDLDPPYAPQVGMTLTSRYSSTFAWTTQTSTAGKRPFDYAIRETKLVKDCSANTSKEFDKLKNWTADGHVGASGTKAYNENSGTLAGNSYTRVVRVKSKGAGGVSDWKYAWHVYAEPFAAKDVDATATKDEDKNTFHGIATWKGTNSASHPVDSVTPQYAMAIPEEGMQCPSDADWRSLPVQKDSKSDKTSFSIDGLLAKDQCLFFRVLYTHDSVDTPSLPVLVKKDGTGYLKDPEFSRSVDKQTTSARVYAENKSDVEDSFVVVTYQDDTHKEYDAGIITGSSEYTDVVYPSNASNPMFGLYAVVGTATYKQTEDGGDGYIISDIKMQSENRLHESGTVPKEPQNLKVTQTDTNTLLVEWDWTQERVDGIEISWSEHAEAWESNEEPDVFTVQKINPNRLYLLNMESGKRWYVRARFIISAEDESYSGYTPIVWRDLVTAPTIPDLELSESAVPQGGEVTATWVYISADGLEQESATIYEVIEQEGEEPLYDQIVQVGEEQSAIIPTDDWETGTTHNLVVVVTSKGQQPSEPSAPKPLMIADGIECHIDNTNLVSYNEDYDDSEYETMLKMAVLPLEVTVTGAGEGGQTSLLIERAEPYKDVYPDESLYMGYEHEAIYQDTYDGETSQEITLDALGNKKFDDGALYRIKATIKDKYGQTASDQLEFKVIWSKQAQKPNGVVEIVNDTARIKVIKPQEANEDDYCNIYRLSAGKPELIVEHGEFYDDTSEETEKATTYVDPYPTIGEYGYRVALFTANGDYITPKNQHAWDDVVCEYNPAPKTIIDFGDDGVSLDKNVDISNTYAKDFISKKYLGGSVQGDWNAGVARTASISAVAITLIDPEDIAAMDRLANYTGACNIRTRSGANFHADVQVSDTDNHDKAGFVKSYSLAITGVEAPTLDGLTVEAWEGEQENAVE